MRWCVILFLLAACEDETKAPAPAPVPEPVAEPEPVVVAPPDAQPEVSMATRANRAKIDDLVTKDLSDSLAKFQGLEAPEDEAEDDGKVGVGDGPRTKVALEGAAGDFEGLSKEEIDRVVKSRRGVLRVCFERAWNADPSLAGKLVIAFSIAADGHVSSASTVRSKSTLRSASVEECVETQIMRLKFPAKGGAQVNYPFVFSSS